MFVSELKSCLEEFEISAAKVFLAASLDFDSSKNNSFTDVGLVLLIDEAKTGLLSSCISS